MSGPPSPRTIHAGKDFNSPRATNVPRASSRTAGSRQRFNDLPLNPITASRSRLNTRDQALLTSSTSKSHWRDTDKATGEDSKIAENLTWLSPSASSTRLRSLNSFSSSWFLLSRSASRPEISTRMVSSPIARVPISSLRSHCTDCVSSPRARRWASPCKRSKGRIMRRSNRSQIRANEIITCAAIAAASKSCSRRNCRCTRAVLISTTRCPTRLLL